MPTSDALHVALSDLLAAVQGILGANVPPMSYVAASNPPLECPMLTVHLDGIQIAPSNVLDQGSLAAGRRRAVNYQATAVVTITRCAPQPDELGNPPSAALYTAFAAALLTDLYEIYSGIRKALVAGSLLAGCRYKTLGQANPLNEQGGQAGWQIPVVFAIDGITP